jgi:hypothetical protein
VTATATTAASGRTLAASSGTSHGTTNLIAPEIRSPVTMNPASSAVPMRAAYRVLAS